MDRLFARRLCCLLLIVARSVSAESDIITEDVLTAEAPRARIAIIIDDLGYMSGPGRRTIALPAPVACAILPHTPYSHTIAEQAHAAGKEVLLHLPLQPTEERLAASVGAIRIDTTEAQLIRIVNSDLGSVPHVIGVNNHMGSLLTQHPGHMDWLMGTLKNRGNLFFVDSYTSESSVALHFAREHGVPAIRRDVFLDHEPDIASISLAYERLKQIARKNGSAIGIGHPYPSTLSFLEVALPLAAAEGIEVVAVSELLATEIVAEPAVVVRN
jgi:polysaccharide deacetylase 2 family uncharacterized protein YibQ